ncbi:RNA polymerase sigma factor [Cronobacter phage vB_CsaP_009]|uniref:RNA polymerase ECF sigma factor n=1 Tax=Cronobacter phage vB_CsaP_009 TaxID=2699738 RepID=A0A679FE19_9CAUD|nr:RNA polymerase sigma factor [Cronobacter phage vB_CsaP_009]BBU72759.1 RNA polymerase ECF sigma factor [Cronobacter phage vB_CsaP_009]
MAKRVIAPEPKKKGRYSFEELYTEYWKPLRDQFYFTERDFHLAEDLAQETLLRVWLYWDRIQWDKLTGAIGTIANNVRYGYVRKEFDRPDKEIYDNILDFESHDDGITDPIRDILNDESSKFIQMAFNRLKDDDKELFTDIYLRNTDTKEVAKKHGITLNFVYVRLHRIRNSLVSTLERYDISFDAE